MNGTWKDEYFVKILEIENVTHDVKRFKVTKPKGYQFIPGEATDIVINKTSLKKKRKPFSFTGLNDWNFLEFIIKIYEERKGMTYELHKLQVGDELILHDSFGAFQYKGVGSFIAGGAGVTPFIAILRQLQKENKLKQNQLICSNKTVHDIILEKEWNQMLGNNFLNTITGERTDKYDNGIIDKRYLKQKITSLDQYFYICGPDKMVEKVLADLLSLGVEDAQIIREHNFNLKPFP